MNKPNLFHFATSELSQDAFICWLLSWASPEYKTVDTSLHHCATELIKEFFKKHSITYEGIDEVEIRKQDKNIDVLCIVNKKYIVIIEDKTGTKNHSNQLQRYLDEIKGRKYEDENIIPIYFKTEDQSDYWDVLANGYEVFHRSDFLEVLNSYTGRNSILIDYREQLQSISDRVDSYLTKCLDDWEWHSWVGFYLKLQKELGDGNWDYVSNPNGGFLGYWWHFQGDNECEQYLQLEQDKFCIKVRVRSPQDRTNQRKKWHEIIQSKGNELYGDLKFAKPIRFGHGEFMTVCVMDRVYRIVNHDKVIDIEKTVELLKRTEDLLKSVA